MAITGTMQMKMPANSIATSSIGPQREAVGLAVLGSRQPQRGEQPPATKMASRTMFCSSISTPKIVNEMPGFQ